MYKGLSYSVISAVAFGALPILGKIGYAQGFETFEMLAYRYAASALMLGAWLAVARPHLLRPNLATVSRGALLGCMVYPVQSFCFFNSLQYISASTTSLVFYLYPATVALCSVIIFRQRADKSVWLSLILVGSGCALVFMDAFMQQTDMRGIAFALGAMGMYSVYMIVAQVILKDESPFAVAFYALTFATLVFIALAWPLDLGRITAARATTAVLLGLIPTVLGVVFLFLGIELIGSTLVSIFSSLEPVSTLALAFLVLGDHIAVWQLAGTALIVMGIVLPNLIQARRGAALPPPSSPPPAAGP